MSIWPGDWPPDGGYTAVMAKVTDALDYLAKPADYRPCPVCVVFGDEDFLCRRVVALLRKEVFGDGDGDADAGFSLSTFEGRGAQLADVLGELETVAMFGEGRRMVVVDAADDFIKNIQATRAFWCLCPRPGHRTRGYISYWPAKGYR